MCFGCVLGWLFLGFVVFALAVGCALVFTILKSYSLLSLFRRLQSSATGAETPALEQKKVVCVATPRGKVVG